MRNLTIDECLKAASNALRKAITAALKEGKYTDAKRYTEALNTLFVAPEEKSSVGRPKKEPPPPAVKRPPYDPETGRFQFTGSDGWLVLLCEQVKRGEVTLAEARAKHPYFNPDIDYVA